ncbi:MAG: hypothetical protein ACM3NZ_03135, partial [Betaproteobacteria bacterium]
DAPADRESDMTTLQQGRNEEWGKLRARLSVGAALCVLGLASLVWWHDRRDPSSVALPAAFVASDGSAIATAAAAPPATTTGVPSAESVFRGRGYVAPEAPIAQF